ncbi:hypothetical protein [Trueperella bialowiezensis]|uniref:Uncharacterized protein n=1 Tax=Trueperella bialowiezensis TaxID=312285 RepID=A0A3S4YXV5_9ACTO|nr:hypothetical protein [Trueperella bialowiezensis]VEI13239.1 Uncharacterised protein [Trueperella bialowiezensis]
MTFEYISPDYLDDARLHPGDIIRMCNGEAAIFHVTHFNDERLFFWRTTGSVWLDHPLPKHVFPIRLLYSHYEEANK